MWNKGGLVIGTILALIFFLASRDRTFSIVVISQIPLYILISSATIGLSKKCPLLVWANFAGWLVTMLLIITILKANS